MTNIEVEMERLNISYEQLDLLKEIVKINKEISNSTKPYTTRRVIVHSVISESNHEQYSFPFEVCQIVVMPVPVDISLYLDEAQEEYNIHSGESLTITAKARSIEISNTANSGITEKVRIYIFGR